MLIDAGQIPEPPEGLRPEAHKWWREHVYYLKQMGRWEAADAGILGVLADLLVRHNELSVRMKEEPLVVPTPDGVGAPNPIYLAQRTVEDNMLELLCHFGFSPLSRAVMDGRATVTPAEYMDELRAARRKEREEEAEEDE